MVHLKKQPCEVGKSPGWHEEWNSGSASRSLGNPPQQHQKTLTSIPGAFCMFNCEHKNNKAEQGKASLILKPKVKEKPSSWWHFRPWKPWKGDLAHLGKGTGLPALPFPFALPSARLGSGCTTHPTAYSDVFLSLKYACMISMCIKIWHSYIQPLPKCVPCSSLCFSQHNKHNLIFHN